VMLYCAVLCYAIQEQELALKDYRFEKITEKNDAELVQLNIVSEMFNPISEY
jgi:hypothetical protein